MSKKRNKIIDVTVQGGCVDIAGVPDGINVVVRDYDTESYDEDDDRLTTDKEGIPYIKRVFGK